MSHESIISASAVAAFLHRQLQGGDSAVRQPADLGDAGPGHLVWLRDYSPETVTWVNQRCPALVVCNAATATHVQVPCIVSPNPRLDFIRAVAHFFAPPQETGIHPTALIASGAVVGERVTIGPYARIGDQVTIGGDCVIGGGVSLEGEVILGRGCRLKANSVIGAAGFGFERDEDGTPVHFPHLGRVVLEDGVWLGACTTVERATLGATRLCANVKVDDLVQVGHNTITGQNTLIMANTVICGGATIGRDCWIAPNSVIKQKVRIGNRVTVGLGAVVIRDVPDGVVVAGVPAKPLPGK
jgi:UDP-3-O-[3-hydroxymyristoyl] glucosamine N-acyltransferase